MSLASIGRYGFAWAAALTALAGFAAPSGAASILFNDFSDLSPLQVNGATQSIHGCAPSGAGSTCGTVTGPGGGNVLRLTNNLSQGGSAFSTTTVSLDANVSFSTAFKFQFTDQQNSGADGIVFVVQTLANNVGGIGGGIGYQGIGNSVGIEFDNWLNGGSDINDNHVGINVNGSVTSVAAADLAPLVLDSGTVFTAWIDYDGTTDQLEVRVSTDGVRPAAAILNHSIDLVGVLGSTAAFVGFTSGTGSAGADHDILSWQFNTAFDPIEEIGQVPEPAALAVLGVGLLGLGALRRRRRG